MRHSYKTIKDFSNDLLEEHNVNVICHYEYAVHIIEELIKNGAVLIGAKIDPSSYNGYDCEYLVSLYNNEIYCEPKKLKDKYLYSEGLHFVHQDCNSSVLKYIGGTVIEFSIDEYDGEEENGSTEIKPCSSIEYSKGPDGKIHGYTYSSTNGNSYVSQSYYSTNELDMNKIKDMIDKLK